MTTDLRAAVTAMLDTDGVHPGNDSWYAHYDAFFEQHLKNGNLDEAINSTLDAMGVTDSAVRVDAWTRFYNVYNGHQPTSFTQRVSEKGKAVAASTKERWHNRHNRSEPDQKTKDRRFIVKRGINLALVALLVVVVAGLFFHWFFQDVLLFHSSLNEGLFWTIFVIALITVPIFFYTVGERSGINYLEDRKGREGVNTHPHHQTA